MSFSASHAAFEGFRLIGRRPFSVVLWTVTLLVFCAALVALLLAVAWPTLVEIDGMKKETLDHAAALRLFGPLGLAVAAIVPLALLMNGVILAALYRAVLTPEKVGFGYLRLGADELRQVVVCLLQFLLAVAFVAVPVAAVVHLRLAVAFTPGHWAAVVLGGLAALLLFVWVGVRLSLAGPMTLAESRVRFLKSWSFTRGRFWPLFAMYVLANVLACVVYFVGSMLAEAALAAFGAAGTFAYRDHDLPDLAAITPQIGVGLGVYFLVQMILSTVQFAVAYAPQAAAYRDLSQERAG